MTERPAFDFRLMLIQLAGNANLVLGGLFIAFGLWVLLAGADAVAALVQVKDAATDAVGTATPAGEAKQIAGVLDIFSKGIGAVIVAMAVVVAIGALIQGVPLLLVGVGILCRQGWARVFGLIFGVLGLLQGLACLGAPQATRALLLTGVGLVAYGVVSLMGLLGRRASAIFASRDVQPSSSSSAALFGPLASCVVLGGVILLTYLNLPRPATLPPPSTTADTKLTEKLQGVWIAPGVADLHRIAFAKAGVFYYATDRGSAQGTYKVVDKQTLAVEYELPEVLYQAQKLAYDQAKQTFDDPSNPYKGLFNVIEPMRAVKDRLRFHLEANDALLTLHYARKPIQYGRMNVPLETFERQLNEQLAQMSVKPPLKVEPKQPEPVAVVPKANDDDIAARYQVRLRLLNDAISKGQGSRVKEMLKTGVSPNDRDDKGETPLMKALQAGYIDIVKLLLEQGADCSVTDRDGHDLFYHAIVIGRFKLLVEGLGGKADSDAPGIFVPNGSNSRYHLAWYEHVRADKRTLKGLNSFMLAAAHGHAADLKFLYSALRPERVKEALQSTDHDGKTALDHAEAKGHKEIVAWLETVAPPAQTKVVIPKIGKEPAYQVSTDKLELAFLKACQVGDLDAVDQALKEAGSQAGKETLLRARDTNGKTALIHAAARGEPALLLLLSQLVRANGRFGQTHALDSQQRTALHYAAEAGHLEALDSLCMLMTAGWKNFQSSQGNPEYVLHWFRCLHQRDTNGKTALELAEGKGQQAVVDYLKKYYQTGFAAPDANKLVVLEVACQEGDLPTVKGLLAMGCPQLVPGRDYSKDALQTPMHRGIQGSHLLVVKALLDAFGDDRKQKAEYLALRARDVGTVLQYAEASEARREIALLLRKHGAK